MSYIWQGGKIKLRAVEMKDFEGYFYREEEIQSLIEQVLK